MFQVCWDDRDGAPMDVKFECSEDGCGYASKNLTNVLKHCSSVHNSFDTRILLNPQWIYLAECSEISQRLDRAGLCCDRCNRYFTTQRSFQGHAMSRCAHHRPDRGSSSPIPDRSIDTVDAQTQTDTEYMCLEEELIVLRREYAALANRRSTRVTPRNVLLL